MLITRKEQYALRAVFELAKRRNEGLIKIPQIAEAQSIPVRFLEVILSQLKRRGIVKSKRGYSGGYILAHSPFELTVGDVIRGLQDSEAPVTCAVCTTDSFCPFLGSCVFAPMWDQVQEAIGKVYDGTTIQNLLDSEKIRQ